MKKTITIFTFIISFATISKAQNYLVADFEDLNLPVDSFYVDSTGADFMSNYSTFVYDWTQSPWGDYWSGGFAYSTMRDSVTSGYGNLYSAKTAIGNNNSFTYLVGQNGAKINIPPMAIRSLINSCYITNSTYAYNSMRDGDLFAKKFGGATGNDPDWFKLTIKGSTFGFMQPDSIEFYLADFRFSDNSQDYILKTWEFVDITPLGYVDTLYFNLSSSDVGSFGMNTPAFFCMDDFSTPEQSGINENANSKINISIFPTPVNDKVTIQLESKTNENGIVIVKNSLGQQISASEIQLIPGDNKLSADYSYLSAGIYFLSIETKSSINTIKFVKN